MKKRWQSEKGDDGGDYKGEKGVSKRGRKKKKAWKEDEGNQEEIEAEVEGTGNGGRSKFKQNKKRKGESKVGAYARAAHLHSISS